MSEIAQKQYTRLDTITIFYEQMLSINDICNMLLVVDLACKRDIAMQIRYQTFNIDSNNTNSKSLYIVTDVKSPR